METTKTFTDSQRSAIDWNDGSVIVLAGPGSGKTAVLTERIIRLLNESDNETYRILSLTFTNKAAAEMSERISKGITSQQKRLFVGTFHSFCSDVLRNHGSYVGVKSDFEIFTNNIDFIDIISDLKKEYFTTLQSFELENNKILNAIQYFEKNLCLSAEDLDKYMPITNYSKEFKWFYFKYQERLLSLNALDFDMLILLTYKLFLKYPNITRIYRSIYKYICVDEFQDTNYGQYALLKILCGDKHKNLFIVADDDQVIYGWNGASHKRLSEFKDDFSAGIIQLNQNFRCPSKVVELANKLISHNLGRTNSKKPLEAMNAIEDKESVFLYSAEDFDQETQFVKDTIIHFKKNNSNESICVLARNNRLLDKVYEVLHTAGINCLKSKRKDEFETSYVSWIHTMLKLSNHRSDEKLLSIAIDLFNTITNNRLLSDSIIINAQLSNGDLLKSYISEIIPYINDGLFEKSMSLDLCEGKSFLKFVDNAFQYMDKQIASERLVYADEHFVQIETEYLSEKRVWNSIKRHIGHNYDLNEITLSVFLQEFAMVSKEEEPAQDVVQCLTIHASKGKEFDNVFLIGMVDDELPSFQSIKKGSTSTEMEEERRNCFVAITRTKKRLIMSYSERYFGWSKKPSRFLLEMYQ